MSDTAAHLARADDPDLADDTRRPDAGFAFFHQLLGLHHEWISSRGPKALRSTAGFLQLRIEFRQSLKEIRDQAV
ncbi:MAG: hypothetical protein J0H37_06755, partial [Hyphomicrobium denitrificans]|nr:hypothetical protein [Hyphomicrobium denitrificans]